MAEYCIRRILALIPVLLGASAIIFFCLRLYAPVDIVEEKLLNSPGAHDPVVRERLRQEFGLDRPIHVQYVTWLWGAVRGDLGTSWSSGRPVVQHIVETLPVTFEITFFAMLIAVIMGVPLGVISAANRGSWFDYASRFFAVLGLSIPNFVIATVLLLGPAMLWGWAPPIGYAPPWENLAKHLTQISLPLLALAASVSATKVRILRSSMLEVLRNDYVRTARAKGLVEGRVVYGHAFRNALIPAVTVLGTQLGATLGGSVVVEQIYSLPGLGQLTLSSILRGDFPQIQACVIYLLVVYLFVNLLVDISYVWLDPRIQYR
jgi:peptide/nickel transport system permease protein